MVMKPQVVLVALGRAPTMLATAITSGAKLFSHTAKALVPLSMLSLQVGKKLSNSLLILMQDLDNLDQKRKAWISDSLQEIIKNIYRWTWLLNHLSIILAKLLISVNNVDKSVAMMMWRLTKMPPTNDEEGPFGGTHFTCKTLCATGHLVLPSDVDQ
ncbi:hypothetical protein SLEP1_g49671 [Rubroshorea leprosula]|uniref:Uncharacterized protein n=1 Tax=Rubroshorea leprosula TaxID=152421 RepID=A0AAV5LZU5_9ROSI|nr:hypothetical protein SLEP1_g49671 [Rubroshorea leprosula]